VVDHPGKGEEGISGENPEGPEHSGRDDPGSLQNEIPDSGGLEPEAETAGEKESPKKGMPFDPRFLLRDVIARFGELAIEEKKSFSEEDFYAIGDLGEAELKDAILSLVSKRRDIDARAKYGLRMFRLTVAWLFVGLLTVWASASRFEFSDWNFWWCELPVPYLAGFELSDAVLMMLLGTTTANVMGLLYIVMNYLFPSGKPSSPEKK